MTNKEAIKILSSWAECKYKPTHDAACLAIAALQAQAEAEKNDPLTLEELREMDGEPVWVETPGMREYGQYSVVEGVDIKSKSLFLRNDFTRHGYGKTWLAYRRRPEDTP